MKLYFKDFIVAHNTANVDEVITANYKRRI